MHGICPSFALHQKKEDEIPLCKADHTFFLQQKYWDAPCALEIDTVIVDIGVKQNPYIVDSWKILKPFFFGPFIRRIRREMLRKLAPAELKHYTKVQGILCSGNYKRTYHNLLQHHFKGELRARTQIRPYLKWLES